MTTPAPWEASLFDSTRGLSVYTIMAAHALFTKSAILSFYNTVEQDHGSPDTISAAYADAGVSFLVAAGLATFNGTTIAPTRTDASGKPWPIQRANKFGFDLEFAP